MFPRTFAAAALLSLGAAAQADTRQIALGLGLTAEEAAGLSLTELAVMKHNAETRGDDRVVLPVPGDAGPAARLQLARAAGIDPAAAAEMSLTALAAARTAREAGGDDRIALQPQRPPASADPQSSADPQFAASAGVAPEIARSLTLHELFLVQTRRRSGEE